MTYWDLLDLLRDMEPEQLENTVTVYDSWSDEYIPVMSATVAADDGVLDHPHIVLNINTGD